MNVLIVIAHPETRSFSAALKDCAVAMFRASGHQVIVSDLYAMRWKAGLDGDDFIERLQPGHLDLGAEQEHAMGLDLLPDDIRQEQDKLRWCDLLILQFPMWWFGMPALMKGWIDRTLMRGFAYSAGRKYDSGLLRGRRAMVCTTTGTPSSLYEPNGIDGDLLQILWPIHNGILHYVGFEVLPPFVVWRPAKIEAHARTAALGRYVRHLQGIDRLEPLFFHPRSDYDESERLKPGIEARSGFQWNPRAGQSRAAAARRHAAVRGAIGKDRNG